jgi:23S rRNA (uracil1939-C5)-methyltransferase
MGRRAVTPSEPQTGVVESLNHDGWGVIRSGKAVFVPGALPGETVEYLIRRRERSYDEAELLQVLVASPDRVEPPCAHYGRCGGCSLQHLSSHSQLAIKEDMLRETLRRVGKVEPLAWLPPLSGQSLGYRRRARLGARFVHAKGRSLVGFRERLSSFVAAIDKCVVLAPVVGEQIAALSELVSRLSIPTRIPQIEVAIGDNAVVLVLRTLDPLSDGDKSLLREFASVHGVHWLLQPGGPNALESLDGEPPDLWYEIPDYQVRMHFKPADFIQVNGEMNRLLVGHVLGALELDGHSRVLDLYCGLGNFTLPMARTAQSALGIEGELALVERAEANARANGIANARFAKADLAGPAAVERCMAAVGREAYSHVLLDPPRTGAWDVLPAVAAVAPRRLVYVSCHPGSLARDLARLVTEFGFELQSAGIADMFPHTSHVESVAVLTGPGRAKK